MPHWPSRTAVAGAIALALLLSGCAADPLAEQYAAGDNKGYIAGDGSVVEIPPAERGDPIQYAGTTDDGAALGSTDYTGRVTVVNFWYAACAPCRLEAKDLEATYQKYLPQQVGFVGVNVRDQPATARGFADTFGVTYPSLVDTDGGVQFSFAGEVAPNAVPTTIVLDREGRVAARILGRVLELSILNSLIDTALEEPL
jgi:thiol-disulfide isomerase/thioredoxin